MENKGENSMKQTKHSILLILLALCLLLSAIACTPQTKPEPAEAPDEAAATEQPADQKQEEKPELTVWAHAPTSIIDMETNTQTIWYEEFSGVHVNWILETEEPDTKMNLSIASGAYPDMYMKNLTTAQVILNASNEIFIPLNDLIDSNGIYYQQILEENPVIKNNLTAPDGNIYTFFRNDAGVHMISRNKMFVYQPWLDNLGLEMPQSTEEFKNMLIAFRDLDANGNGNASDEIPLASSYSAWHGDPTAFLMNPFQLWSNNYLLGMNNKVSCVAVTDEFREGLKYINELFEEGLIAEETFVQDTSQLKSMINKSSKEEMLVGTFATAHVGQYVDLSIMPDSLLEYLPVAPLAGPSGNRQADSDGSTVLNLYGAITSACKNPDIAMEWVDKMFSQEGLERNFFGMEGYHFDWSEDPAINGTTPSRTLTYTYMEPDNDWWHGYGIGPVFDSISLRYQETNVPGGLGWSLYMAHEVYEPYYKMIELPILSWATDEELSTELSELKILIDEYIEQAYTQFILGVKDINDDNVWESYKDELTRMGLDRYIELNQIVNFGE